MIKTLEELAKFANYSLVETLNSDPHANKDGMNHFPREVFSGHFVPVLPTPIENPKYISHSKKFFSELGFDDSLAHKNDFMSMFSADTSNIPDNLNSIGWACGYALSIYGTEYYHQCPFQTGNGYGDGRAISILEVLIDGKRWEMQLKGGGRTPYCRGADGRAVLRSSIREFLAQEHMYALNIPSSRSLSLYTSNSETVKRPWFNKGSYSRDPEVMIDETVAISTRVAPSFLRVGQFELFARRTRKNEHPKALEELEKIVLHGIDREYKDIDREYKDIDKSITLEEKILLLAKSFQTRLISLVSNWIRVGYCQGNFNGDNCAIGGFTLDYGPFGFIDMFDPEYQPWTGGGMHFSFFNQAQAAKQNFKMFCKSLEPLLESYPDSLEQLNDVKDSFVDLMNDEMEKMWANKLGMDSFDEDLFSELMELMLETSVDYTIFFRELSSLPKDIRPLEKSFYRDISTNEDLAKQWSLWFEKWKLLVKMSSDEMKKINPKYTLREWFLVPAYEEAIKGDYTLIKELQEVMNDPYSEQSKDIEDKYYSKKPLEFFDIAGISHVSCSS
jgi:uncharacterized protein YdiU (UPF0061 family)